MRCQPDCTCGRHVGYVRTDAQRVAASARQKGVIHASIEERFWTKVDRVGRGECWPWLGATFVNGYGKLFLGRDESGRSQFAKAHRLSWEMANGRPVPVGLSVLHSCDNP